MNATATATAIKALPFGNKGDIARTLTTKGAELKGSILFNAIAPMLSNMAQGHKTFSPVFANTYKGNCPLCVAVATLKGKAKTARDSAYQVFKDTDKTIDQNSHDSLIEFIELAIFAAIAPGQATKTTPTNWKNMYEASQARVLALEIDKAELTTLLHEAGIKSPAPSEQPALV